MHTTMTLTYMFLNKPPNRGPAKSDTTNRVILSPICIIVIASMINITDVNAFATFVGIPRYPSNVDPPKTNRPAGARVAATAGLKIATAVKDTKANIPSANMAPPPIKWASGSLSSCFDETEDPIKLCQPEMAPQAIVTNISFGLKTMFAIGNW